MCSVFAPIFFTETVGLAIDQGIRRRLLTAELPVQSSRLHALLLADEVTLEQGFLLLSPATLC